LIRVAPGQHELSKELSAQHLLRAAEVHIGRTIQIPTYDEVRAIKVEEDVLVLSTYHYEVRELKHRIIYDLRRLRVMVWFRQSDAPGAPKRWTAKPEIFEVDDEDFVTVEVVQDGFHKTLAERQADRNWEAMCHRPGTSRHPMDSADRALEGDSPMTKYWSLKS